MDSVKAVKIIAVAVAAGGLVEVLGWVFGVLALKSVLPSMVTMKFSTAVSFFLSGITLFFIAESGRGHVSVSQVVIPVTTLLVMLIMATLLASALLGLKTGVEDLFIKEEAAAVKTTVPGRPSLVTMADFIVFAAAGIGSLFRYRGQKNHMFFSGLFIIFTGAIALSGYILGSEYLFFSWPGVSTGMALVTAVLFELLGAGLIMLSRVF